MQTPNIMCALKCIGWPIAIWLVCCLAVPLASAESAKSRDYGVIWNSDGDIAITSADPHKSLSRVEYAINTLAETPVKTVTFSVGAGSEILLYPTEVANTWGWRETSYDEEWSPRIQKGRACAEAGMDAPRAAGERAKALGMYFFPSYRMNDGHFIFDPEEYPLTGKFWLDHPEYRIGASGPSPSKTREEYANLLDYSHAEVRQYRLDVIFEVIDRYKDIMDGIELDFTRSFYLFPMDEGQEKAHLVTEMLDRVRAKLDETTEETGKSYAILARIAPSLRNNMWAGLDVRAWLEKGLVDILAPSQLMTAAFEMPLDELVPLAHEHGCQVYANIYPRAGWEYPFVEDPAEASYQERAGRAITPPLLRAVASNYWAMGADGMYLYNFGAPSGLSASPDACAWFRDVAHPAGLDRASKTYAVTKAYYLDFEDTNIYAKELERELKPDSPAAFHLMVGEDFTDPSTRFDLRYCGLRLGFQNLPEDAQLTVHVNGELFHEGSAGKHLVPVTAPESTHSAMTPAALQFWQREVTSPENQFKRGINTVTIAYSGGEKGFEDAVVVTDVNLGVFYDNNLGALLFAEE